MQPVTQTVFLCLYDYLFESVSQSVTEPFSVSVLPILQEFKMPIYKQQVGNCFFLGFTLTHSETCDVHKC